MSRILMFAPYFPPHVGGLETFAHELSEELVSLGHDVTVVTTRLPKENTPHVTGYTLRRFPAFELVTNFPIMFPWPHLTGEYDVVLSHTRFFTTSLQAWWYAWRHALPWIHIEHGSWFVSVSNPLTSLCARLYDYTFGRFVLRHSTQNIAISKAVASFVQRFDQRPIPVMYRGIDTERILQARPYMPEDTETKGKIVAATASRLFRWKGLENSITAVLSLPPELQRNLVYFIIGGGEDFDRLQALAKPPVYLLGELPYEKTIGILKNADIYVHSAHKGGGLSTALIEAMYCACAVVATPNEGAAEVITDGKTGLSVPGGDPAALQQALVRLSRADSLRATLAGRGKNYVEEHFSWNQNAQVFSKAIQQTIAIYARRSL